MMLPKPKRITDRAYLKWVKQLECAVAGDESFPKTECAGPIDPHHAIPVSIGGGDHTAVPLCRKHHDLYQSSMSARAIFVDFALTLHELYRRENQTRSRATSQQKIRTRNKRQVLRAYVILRGMEFGLPVFESIKDAECWRKENQEKGRIVRCQVRIEGK